MDGKTTLDKDAIKNVLDGMLGVIEKENVELYKSLIDKTHSKEINSVDGFYFTLIYPYDKFLSGLIKTEISDNGDVGFILKRSQFIESHFEALIRGFEGYACCADKSETIMERLLDFYKEGKRIVFDYEQEYTFHLPSVIFKTHESIIGFYEGLKMLYCGNPEKYLTELQKIATHNTQKQKGLEGDKHVVAVE